MKCTWLWNLIGLKQVLLNGLFVIGYRYESRARLELGCQRGGGPMVQVPYRVIEGVMDLILWAEIHNWVVGKDLTSNTSYWKDSNILNH